MSTEVLFSDSSCEDEIHAAERELAAFFEAVKRLFGPRQARLAAEDWLYQADLTDSSHGATSRDWRVVTIAASTRLANRLTVETDHQMSLAASLLVSVSPETKVLPIPSSGCFPSAFPV